LDRSRFTLFLPDDTVVYEYAPGHAVGNRNCCGRCSLMRLLLAALPCLVWLAGAPRPMAAQQVRADTVVVTASADPVPFDSLARTVTVLTRDEIRSLPVRSLAELLDYTAAVDVRSRGPYGVQADFSIRGSSYSQVLVLVDGVRINDSQTAHHNADLPIALEDIERIEILSGPGSALYGADAFGGTINIITARDGSGFRASGLAGQFGTFEGSARLSVGRGGFRQSLSIFGSRSAGFMFDRDYRTAGFHAGGREAERHPIRRREAHRFAQRAPTRTRPHQGSAHGHQPDSVSSGPSWPPSLRARPSDPARVRRHPPG